MPTISHTIIRSGKRILVLAASVLAAQVVHGGLNPGVPKLFLDGHDAGSAIEHGHRKRMAEEMRRDRLGDPGPANRDSDDLAQVLLVQRIPVAAGDENLVGFRCAVLNAFLDVRAKQFRAVPGDLRFVIMFSLAPMDGDQVDRSPVPPVLVLLHA